MHPPAVVVGALDGSPAVTVVDVTLKEGCPTSGVSDDTFFSGAAFSGARRLAALRRAAVGLVGQPLHEHCGRVVLQRTFLMGQDRVVEPAQGLRCRAPGGVLADHRLGEALDAENTPSALRASTTLSV